MSVIYDAIKHRPHLESVLVPILVEYYTTKDPELKCLALGRYMLVIMDDENANHDLPDTTPCRHYLDKINDIIPNRAYLPTHEEVKQIFIIYRRDPTVPIPDIIKQAVTGHVRRNYLLDVCALI